MENTFIENRETEAIFQFLHASYNTLIIWHPSTPSRKRVFIVSSFIPSQNLIPYHDLTGKEVTHLISMDYFSQYLGGNDIMREARVLRKMNFESSLDQIETRHYQISGDACFDYLIAG